MSKDYLMMMRDGKELSTSQQLSMIFRLSIPAILAQISNVIMQYIDASMVGRLGANDSASIGLVNSSTWLLWGLSSSICTGFTVLIAKKIGAKDNKGARSLVKTGMVSALAFSAVIAVIAASISGVLPIWLHGSEEIRKGASQYFLVMVLTLPIFQLNTASIGMIQCSGDMKVAGIAEIIICVLDVIYNALLIFPSGVHTLFGRSFRTFGAGLGIVGAALGSALAELTVVLFLLYYLFKKSELLHFRKGEKTGFSFGLLPAAVKIAIPVALEQIVTCSAYIAFTRIVSPLGTIALAANSFSITAESLCYMPGYGIGSAASTIIGQSIGARRNDLTGKLSRQTVLSGTAVMTVGGALMFIFAPFMISILSPDPEIRELGARILRIEAFAEPLFAASIVATGVFRGAGDTVVPTSINLVSMWAVRIPLAAFLAGKIGLEGVWVAMCVELCIRGLLFILLLSTRFRRRLRDNRYSVEL